jgi:hypothetical protein
MTIEAGEVVAALLLTGVAGALAGWLLTRRSWIRMYTTLRRVYKATLASAEESLFEQDQRLEILERECQRLTTHLRAAGSSARAPAAAHDLAPR